MTATTTPVLAALPAPPSVPVVPAMAPLPDDGLSPVLAPLVPIAVSAELQPAAPASESARRDSPRRARRDHLAASAFGASLIGLLVLPLPLGVLAVLLGGLALARNKNADDGRGEGMAIAALVIGIVNVGFWAVWMLSQADGVS